MSDKEEVFSVSEIESLSKNIFDTAEDEQEDKVHESVITGEPYELPEAYESSFGGVKGEGVSTRPSIPTAYDLQMSAEQEERNETLTLDRKDGNSQDAVNQYFSVPNDCSSLLSIENIDEIDMEIERLKKSPGEMAELENEFARTVKTNLAGVVTLEEEFARIRGKMKETENLVAQTNAAITRFVKKYIERR